MLLEINADLLRRKLEAGAWEAIGDSYMLRCFSRVYGVDVHVYKRNARTGEWVVAYSSAGLPGPGSEHRRVVRIGLSGDHFIALLRIEDPPIHQVVEFIEGGPPVPAEMPARDAAGGGGGRARDGGRAHGRGGGRCGGRRTTRCETLPPEAARRRSNRLARATERMAGIQREMADPPTRDAASRDPSVVDGAVEGDGHGQARAETLALPAAPVPPTAPVVQTDAVDTSQTTRRSSRHTRPPPRLNGDEFVLGVDVDVSDDDETWEPRGDVDDSDDDETWELRGGVRGGRGRGRGGRGGRGGEATDVPPATPGVDQITSQTFARSEMMTIKSTLNGALRRSRGFEAYEPTVRRYFHDLVAERTYAGIWTSMLCNAALAINPGFRTDEGVLLSFDPAIFDDNTELARFVRTCYRWFIDTSGHNEVLVTRDHRFEYVERVHDDLVRRGALPGRLGYVPPQDLPGRWIIHQSAADLYLTCLENHLVENYCGRLHVLLQTPTYGLGEKAQRRRVINAILGLPVGEGDPAAAFAWQGIADLVDLVRTERDRFLVPTNGDWKQARADWRQLADGEEITRPILKVRTLLSHAHPHPTPPHPTTTRSIPRQ